MGCKQAIGSEVMEEEQRKLKEGYCRVAGVFFLKKSTGHTEDLPPPHRLHPPLHRANSATCVFSLARVPSPSAKQ